MSGLERQIDFSEDFSQPLTEPKRVYELIKRVQDTVLAATALVLLGPIWLLIAFLVKATTPGPAIYRQRNVGRYGRQITLYKFRTMYANSDDAIHRRAVARFVKGEAEETIEQNGQNVKVYKMTQDPRITPIGRFMRKSGLDEIPQLFNVVKGELSLVGPRAPLLYEYAHYSERHKKRLEVMPGITGLWQVTARSMVPFEQMVDIDLDYANRRSYWLDLKIMLLTPYVLITGKGAY